MMGWGASESGLGIAADNAFKKSRSESKWASVLHWKETSDINLDFDLNDKDEDEDDNDDEEDDDELEL